MKKKNKKMFIKVRGSYLPNSLSAWLLYIPFVGYLVWTLVYSNNTFSSVAEMVFFIVPQFVSATVIMTWIASRNS